MRKSLTLFGALILASSLPLAAGWDEGVAAFKAKNYQQAAQEFQGVVDASPDSYNGYYMLGLTFEKLNRQAESLKALREAYDLNPNDLGVKLALARAYRGNKKYSEVAKLLGTIDAGSLPGSQKVPFYQMRGEALIRTNKASTALNDFKALGNLRPDDAQTQYLIGSTALNLGKIDEGIAAMEKVVRLAPGDGEKAKILVNALLTKGRGAPSKTAKKAAYAKAANVARNLASKSPSYDNLILQVSAELGAGMYVEAARSGNAAIAKNSSDWLAHYYVGQAYTSSGQFVQAINPLQTALTKTQDPNDVKKVWRQLGFAYEKQKDFVKSIDAYNKAGDRAGLARVQENKDTAEFNQKVEEENKRIKEMEAEAKRLEEELKELESGGGL